MTLKVAFKTIGCKVNQYETGTLRQSFIKSGFQVVEFQESADIYIINTCAVTREAVRKSKQMIRKASRSHPRATIIVTGCAVQSNLPDIQACKNVSLIVGNKYKENIFDIIHQTKFTKEEPVILVSSPEEMVNYQEAGNYFTSHRIRGLVKIQDGCNQFCSYCIIPYLRGRGRSRSVHNVLSEIKDFGDRGYKEVVLLGINLGSYGNDQPEAEINLEKLIYKIEQISPIERIRLSSIELPYITEGLIAAFHCSTKLCHQLHIPLQSGDDRILALMRRKYTSEQFRKIIVYLKKRIPDIAITTDVIVGFPGEDEKAFQNTVDLVEEIGFSKVHVFPYSDRVFNLASFLPDRIPEEIINQRSTKMNNISLKLSREFIQRNLGKEKRILIELQGQNENGEYVFGLTDNYIKVFVYNISTEKGKIVKIKIIKVNDSYAIGEVM